MDVKPHTKADLLMLVVASVASLGWIFSKEALQGLPPLLFIGSRFLIAGLLLSLPCRAVLRTFSWRQLRPALMSGGLFATGMGLWVSGLDQISQLAIGAFVTSLAVVLVPIVSLLAFGEKMAASSWLALPVAVVGLWLMVPAEGSLSFESGLLYFVFAAIVFAGHFAYTSQVVRQFPPLPLTALQLCIVGLVTLALSLSVERWPTAVDGSVLGWLLASIVIATSLRFYLQIKAQSMASAGHAAVILTLEPVLTAFAAALWFGERLAPAQLAGCGCVFCALLIARWSLLVRFVRGKSG